MTDRRECGSEPCTKIVDRLGEMMTKQQETGFASVEKLLTVHHQTLKEEIMEVKAAMKDQGNEIFPRLRSVEERVAIIEETRVTDAKVNAAISANENIIWLGHARTRTAKVGIVVAAGIILSMPAWLLKVIVFFGGR